MYKEDSCDHYRSFCNVNLENWKLLSENVRKSGLLSQVMKLSQPDKVALIAYLSKDVAKEESFKADEFGRIKLTPEMRDAVVKAERDYEDDKCFSEADFKERFSKWL